MLRPALFFFIFLLVQWPTLAQAPVASATPLFSESKTYVPRKANEKDTSQKWKKDQVITKSDDTLTLAVAVYDDKGAPVIRLQKGEFRVEVDGTQLEIAAIEEMPDSVQLILLLDKSASLEFIKEQVDKITEGIVDRIGPQDKVTVVGFGEDSKVAIERSGDKSAIRKAVKKLGMRDGTSVYDAVFKIAGTRQGAFSHPIALVIISDAADTTSKHQYHESLMAVERSNLVVFSVYLNTLPGAIQNIRQLGFLNVPKSIDLQIKEVRAQYEMAADFVNDILTLSGGLVFGPSGEIDIAREMRNRYYLTVRLPSDLTPGERHALKVRVKRPGVHVLSKATLID